MAALYTQMFISSDDDPYGHTLAEIIVTNRSPATPVKRQVGVHNVESIRSIKYSLPNYYAVDYYQLSGTHDADSSYPTTLRCGYTQNVPITIAGPQVPVPASPPESIISNKSELACASHDLQLTHVP